MSTAIYNTIGNNYDDTRSADPYITERILDLLTPDSSGTYLDIGCGSGNYLSAVSNMGFQFYGIDPSETMLEKARMKAANATIIQGSADAIPLADNFFDGAIALFTFHHWTNKAGGLTELSRVLKPGAPLVFMTFTGEQMRGYWLNHYFPRMMKRSWELVPETDGMEALLQDAGFKLTSTENYFIQDDLQDMFLYAFKRQPEKYLLPEVRRNISSFAAFCEDDELNTGLAKLEQDIASGTINNVMQQYENNRGDYLFLVAENVKR